MRESLQRICERFVENREVLRRNLAGADPRIRSICASMLLRTSYVDGDLLREARDILNEETGVFSSFRGFAKMPSVTLLALSGQPQTKINSAKETYDILKQHFSRNEYLALAALSLCDLAQSWQMEEIAARGRRLYKRMKKEHRFLTSQEDYGFALLLAMDPRSDDQLIQEMENNFSTLRQMFSSSNGLQTLTHVMVLSGPYCTCDRVREMFSQLRAEGLRYSKNYELGMLGVIAGIPAPVAELVQEMKEVDVFLSNQKGYGVWGIGKKTRLMHAAMLVVTERLGAQDASVSDTMLLSSTIAMIAAEQAALCAIITANAAAAASA